LLPNQGLLGKEGSMLLSLSPEGLDQTVTKHPVFETLKQYHSDYMQAINRISNWKD